MLHGLLHIRTVVLYSGFTDDTLPGKRVPHGWTHVPKRKNELNRWRIVPCQWGEVKRAHPWFSVRPHIIYQWRFYLQDLVGERLVDGPNSRWPIMLTAETFEIRNSLWIFSKVKQKQSTKPNLPITWQIIKHNLPLLPYFQVTILYNVFAGRISLPGMEWIYRRFLTFIFGVYLLKDLHLCRHQQWLFCSFFLFCGL
jgi:hypothetical protein